MEILKRASRLNANTHQGDFDIIFTLNSHSVYRTRGSVPFRLYQNYMKVKNIKLQDIGIHTEGNAM